MAADTTAKKPTLDERYLSATNSSDLTLDPDRLCDATLLIADGLLGNRMGAALVHLRAEWDAAGKPRKATEAEIEERAKMLPKRKDKPDIKRARTEALVGYTVAMRHRAHQMRGWAQALGLLREWAVGRSVDVDVLSPVLYHWLAPTCPVCDGHGVRKIPDTPSLSNKKCHHCEGACIWPRPPESQRIHDWLGRCEGKARAQRGWLAYGAPIADFATSEGWQKLRDGERLLQKQQPEGGKPTGSVDSEREMD